MEIEKEQKKVKENQLGTKSVGKLLLSLSVPAVIGQVVNLLYNMVDRMYIGRIEGVGGTALTGVGVTMPIILIISAFSALVGMGGAPKAAIKMGENKMKDAEKILGNCFSLLSIVSVLLTVFFWFAAEDLLMLFGASAETLPYALQYMRIYTMGTVFVQFALGLNPFITTQGFSKTGMLTVLIGALINIVLDPILIFGFHMGVAGAALATIISQAVSAVWVLAFLIGKKTNLKIRKRNMRLERTIIGPVILLGLSPFVMNITESLINIVFNTSLQKYGGDVAVGTMTILASAMQFAFLPPMGIAQGAQPIIGYNYGAKKKTRVKKTVKYLVVAATSYCTLLWAFLMISPSTFVKIFTNDVAIIEMASWAIRVYLSAIMLMGLQSACQQSLIALGKAKISLFLALLRKVILLIPLVYILPRFLENKVFAVFLAEPIADVIAVSVTALLFFTQFKILMEEMPQEKQGI